MVHIYTIANESPSRIRANPVVLFVFTHKVKFYQIKI